MVGSIRQSFAIDADGVITTLQDRVFNYERQREVFIQVQAQDTLQTMLEPTHITYTQVKIEVIDVNDEPPVLKMVREALMRWNRRFFFLGLNANFTFPK